MTTIIYFYIFCYFVFCFRFINFGYLLFKASVIIITWKVIFATSHASTTNRSNDSRMFYLVLVIFSSVGVWWWVSKIIFEFQKNVKALNYLNDCSIDRFFPFHSCFNLLCAVPVSMTKVYWNFAANDQRSEAASINISLTFIWR